MAERISLSELVKYQKELDKLRNGHRKDSELTFAISKDFNTADLLFAQEMIKKAFVAARNIPEEEGFAALLDLLSEHQDQRSVNLMNNTIMAVFCLLNGRTDSKLTRKDMQAFSKQSEGFNLLLPILIRSLRNEADILYDISEERFLVEFTDKAIKENDEMLRKNPAMAKLCSEAGRKAKKSSRSC